MSAHIALLLGLFGMALLIPFVLAIREYRWPRDRSSLSLDDEYVRDPRHFASSLRDKLAPHVSNSQAELELRLHRHERVRCHDSLNVGARAKIGGIVVVRNNLDTAAGVSLQEAWILGHANLGAGATIRGLACDQNLRLGPNCSVARWVDSERDAYVGRGCDLGVSATAGGTLSVSPGCNFRRLWGQPVRTLELSTADVKEDAVQTIEREVVWAGDRLNIPPGSLLLSGIVAHGKLVIGEKTVVRGPVKSDGELVIGNGSRIEGNVICRNSVRIGQDSHIEGNVFAERDVFVGAGVSIGREGAYKTVYGARNVSLGSGVSVYGWVVAERGGKVE